MLMLFIGPFKSLYRFGGSNVKCPSVFFEYIEGVSFLIIMHLILPLDYVIL
jgi:hypothetical protein